MWHCCEDVEQEVEQKSWQCNKACGTGAEITGARVGTAVLQHQSLLKGILTVDLKSNHRTGHKMKKLGIE